MGFWASPTTEPKRKYRWILNFGGTIGAVEQYLIKNVTKPSFEISETEHKYINHTFWYPGRVTWNEVELTLVDPVSPDASAQMLKALKHSGYEYPLNPNTTQTISKANATEAISRFTISQLGANQGEVIEEWVLKNAWISKVNFGELDYESDDLVEISITVRYDFAVQQTTPQAPPAAPGQA